MRKQIQQAVSRSSTSNPFPQEFVEGFKTDDCDSGPSTGTRYTQRWTLPEGFKCNTNWILKLYAQLINSCIQKRLGEYLKTYPTSDMCTKQWMNTKLSSRC